MPYNKIATLQNCDCSKSQAYYFNCFIFPDQGVPARVGPASCLGATVRELMSELLLLRERVLIDVQGLELELLTITDYAVHIPYMFLTNVS